jgi:hypothetical protein
MSRYAVNKVLWQVARDDAIAAEFKETPEKVLANRGLTEEEHRQLLERDFAALFAAGAHPFLLFTFRIKISGGWSYPMMVEHVKALADIDPPLDITT